MIGKVRGLGGKAQRVRVELGIRIGAERKWNDELACIWEAQLYKAERQRMQPQGLMHTRRRKYGERLH